MSHFPSQYRLIAEVVRGPLSLIYSNLLPIAQSDHLFVPLEPLWALLRQTFYLRITLFILSQLVYNFFDYSVEVRFMFSLFSISVGLGIFSMKVAFAKSLNYCSCIMTLVNLLASTCWWAI